MKVECTEKKNYKCMFKQLGGRCAEVDYDQEAFFALTDEEYKRSVDAIDANGGRLSYDLPEEMFDAIWDVAYESKKADLEEYNEYPDEGVRVEPDAIWDSVFKIIYPEEVK